MISEPASLVCGHNEQIKQFPGAATQNRQELPQEDSQTHKFAGSWLIDHRDANAEVGKPENEVLPQVRFATTVWQHIQRAAYAPKDRDLLFVIECKGGRPVVGFQIEMHSQ